MDHDIPDGFMDMVDNMGFDRAMEYAMNSALAAKSGDTIRHWSYDKPTEPGLYLCCYGDVETHDNIRLVRFEVCSLSGGLMTEDGLRPKDYGTSYKWARLLVRASEVKDD